MIRQLAAVAAISALAFSPALVPVEPTEDSVAWSCVDDGNHVCGPDNPEGKPAGCYDDGGVLEFDWPCQPWTPADGWIHGDGTITYPNGDVGTMDGTIIKVGDHSHDIATGPWAYDNGQYVGGYN